MMSRQGVKHGFSNGKIHSLHKQIVTHVAEILLGQNRLL